MNEDEIRELQEYNLEYLEAMGNEDCRDYTSDVKLKYANKTIQKLQKENQQLKSQLEQSKNETKQRDDVIKQATKFTKEIQESFDCCDDVYKDMNILLLTLNKRGGTDE